MKRVETLIKLPPPTVYPNVVDNVKLRPKLKKPDRDVIGEDAAEAALLKPKRMMGFREWCEKVYNRSTSPPVRSGQNHREIDKSKQ